MPEGVSENYELVFFNVRHRLDGVDYIMYDVIGCSFCEVDDPQKLAQQSLFKLAYSAGSHGMEAILAVRRLLSNSTADTYRRLVRQHVLDNSKLLGLLSADRLQPFGLAADELLTGLLGAPLDLPRGPHTSTVLPLESAQVSTKPLSSHAGLRVAA